MLKSRYFVALNVAAAFCAAAALAGPNDGGVPGNSRGISWDEFKERCANPDAFIGDVQRAPENIKVQCTDNHREYVAAAAGSVPMPATRTVITAVFADKFHVGAEEKDFPVLTKPGSCLRFKEVERTLTIERPMSCGDILGIKGDLDDFCAAQLDLAKGANPKLIEEHETGNVIDTCSGTGPGPTH